MGVDGREDCDVTYFPDVRQSPLSQPFLEWAQEANRGQVLLDLKPANDYLENQPTITNITGTSTTDSVELNVTFDTPAQLCVMYRALGDSGAFTPEFPCNVGLSTTHTYTVSGLQPATIYEFDFTDLNTQSFGEIHTMATQSVSTTEGSWTINPIPNGLTEEQADSGYTLSGLGVPNANANLLKNGTDINDAATIDITCGADGSWFYTPAPEVLKADADGAQVFLSVDPVDQTEPDATLVYVYSLNNTEDGGSRTWVVGDGSPNIADDQGFALITGNSLNDMAYTDLNGDTGTQIKARIQGDEVVLVVVFTQTDGVVDYIAISDIDAGGYTSPTGGFAHLDTDLSSERVIAVDVQAILTEATGKTIQQINQLQLRGSGRIGQIELGTGFALTQLVEDDGTTNPPVDNFAIVSPVAGSQIESSALGIEWSGNASQTWITVWDEADVTINGDGSATIAGGAAAHHQSGWLTGTNTHSVTGLPSDSRLLVVEFTYQIGATESKQYVEIQARSSVIVFNGPNTTRHNGIGYLGDDSAFTTQVINSRVQHSGISNQVIENFGLIAGPNMGHSTGGSQQDMIFLFDCHNLELRNFWLWAPVQEQFYGGPRSSSFIGIQVHDSCSNILINGANIWGVGRGIAGYGGPNGVKVHNSVVARCGDNGMIVEGSNGSIPHEYINNYVYFDPAGNIDGSDFFNFIGPRYIGSNPSEMHKMYGNLAECGWQQNAGGFMIDKNGNYDPMGGVHIDGNLSLDTGNKGGSIAAGINSIYENHIAYQAPASPNSYVNNGQSGTHAPFYAHEFREVHTQNDPNNNQIKTQFYGNIARNHQNYWYSQERGWRLPIPNITENQDWGAFGNPDSAVQRSNLQSYTGSGVLPSRSEIRAPFEQLLSDKIPCWTAAAATNGAGESEMRLKNYY